MSDTSKEELGRRRFQIQKEKAVEDALVKIRRSIGPEWASLSTGAGEMLKIVLGEVWTSVDRSRWDAYSFAALRPDALKSLVATGRDVKDRLRTWEEVMPLLDSILIGEK